MTVSMIYYAAEWQGTSLRHQPIMIPELVLVLVMGTLQLVAGSSQNDQQP
jgi:hypothetical protein